MLKKSLFFAFLAVIAPCLLPAETSSTPEKKPLYVVKRGDCLWNISKKLWNDPHKWPLLFAANEAKIKNPNLIYSGQRFSIPTDLSQEALGKAGRLAQARVEPISESAGRYEKGGELSNAGGKIPVQSKEGATSIKKAPPPYSQKAESGEKPEKEANPPATAGENLPATAPTSLPAKWLLLVVTIVVLIAGIFLWKRKGNQGMPFAQEPKPFSSFPQAPEPMASRPTPSPAPSPSASSQPSNPPPQTKAAEPGVWKSATLTSISIPSTPTPKQPGPSEPNPSSPSPENSTPSSQGKAPAPPSSPAAPPLENKPSDSNNPPTSTNSAA